MKIITTLIWLMSVTSVYSYKACKSQGEYNCRLPFIYYGTTYNICALSNTWITPIPWCYLDNTYNWDYCSNDCFECGESNDIQKSCNMQRGKEGASSNDDFPWHVYIKERDTDKILCNGVIIKNDRVLTTVDCVNEIRSKNIGELFAGSSTRSAPNGYQRGDIISCNTHPDYNNETRENDIAIINLNNKLTWNDKVLPICFSKDYFIVEDHQNATFTGSRIEEDGDNMKNIQYSVVHKVPDFLDSSKCGKNGTFCTTKNSIFSDVGKNEGGPLALYQDSKCVLVGILSKINDTRRVLVFTNVSMHIPWIRLHL